MGISVGSPQLREVAAVRLRADGGVSRSVNVSVWTRGMRITGTDAGFVVTTVFFVTDAPSGSRSW